ncbi:MAG: ATP-binding protein [Bacteroidales bacterium]
MGKYSPEEHFLRKLDAKLREAMDTYGLINDGDKILIGLSGGKDSLALVELLGRRKRVFKPKFEVYAAHITMSNINYEADIKYLKDHCEKYGIQFIHGITEFDPESDKRKSPCFLCSWNRRKKLFDIAKELGCTKLALGHHKDDAVQTLIMNMTFQGAISTMPPKLKMDKFDMTIIRPLSLIHEIDLVELSKMHSYVSQKKACPYETTSYRSTIKSFVKQLEELNPHALDNIYASMQNLQVDYLPQAEQKK